MSKMSSIRKNIQQKLEKRKAENAFRFLHISQNNQIDFASNDYLGLAKEVVVKEQVGQALKGGSTGSRLITGTSKMHIDLEGQFAQHYYAESALLYNSGYDANIGVLSAVLTRHHTVIIDEYVHASIKDGIRLSEAKMLKFKHNNLSDLKRLLEQQEDIFNINGHEMMSAISANGGIEGNSGNPGYSHEVEGGFSLSGAVLDLGVVTSQDFDKLYISVHGNADGVVPYTCDKPFGSFLIDFSYPFELAEQAYIEAQNTLTQTLESSNELSSSLSSLTEDMYEDLDAYSYAEAAWNEATSYLNTLDSEVCTYTPEVPSVELTPYIPAAIITPEIPESCTPEVWSPAVDATYSPYVPAVEAWVPEVCTPSIPAVYAPNSLGS